MTSFETGITDRLTLDRYLAEWSSGDLLRVAVAQTIGCMAEATIEISKLLSEAPLTGNVAETVGVNADGDPQKQLDLLANEIIFEAMTRCPVAVFGSEENESEIVLHKDAPLAVAVDPLDGSSNINANVTIGTIFSILNVGDAASPATDAHTLLRKGVDQLAAGFAVYGPQTALVITVCEGVQVFVLNAARTEFRMETSEVLVPEGTPEYAINASNYRFWERAVRVYIDHCVADDQQRSEPNFNMRWIASLVADTYRILRRGGIFLYPRDSRSGYESGRLRLIFEANPIALVVEQAGGAATDGARRILEIQPTTLHQRIPLFFGSKDHVAKLARHQSEPFLSSEAPPLFGTRGLFQR